MSHDNHIIDNINKDTLGYSYEKAKRIHLWLSRNWQDPNPKPVIENFEGVNVIRDDLTTGTKVRGADLLMSKIKQDTIAYVVPRTGLAGVSILEVAKRHNKKVRFFMPSSKRISYHQACCIEQGCDYEFHRIAAMPNLNRIAKIWADQNDAFFIPLGLKHLLVTSALVKVASQIPEPDEVWTAISTGVLSRSLQIAWPNAKFYAVAVSRNMKEGELGRAKVISAPEAFTKPVKQEEMPPFPSIGTYDAKVWRYIPKDTSKNILFWNVGKEPTLKDETIYDKIDSYRDWPCK